MFHPLQTWSAGPLTLSFELTFLFISVMAGFYAVSLYLKRLGSDERENVMDPLATALIGAVVVYKFWPFVLEPSLVLQLQNLIYFSGGPWAVPAALVTILIILSAYQLKRHWPLHVWEAFLGGMMTSLIVFNLFVRQYGAPSPLHTGFPVEGTTVHPVNVYEAWLYIMVLTGAIVFFRKNQTGARIVFLLIATAAAYVLVSPFRI